MLATRLRSSSSNGGGACSRATLSTVPRAFCARVAARGKALPRGFHTQQPRRQHHHLLCSSYAAADRTTPGGPSVATHDRNDDDAAAADNEDEDEPRSRVPLRAVVIGAGPAGTLAAIVLASRGWAVDVYERRAEGAASDPRRTFLIGLGARGVGALRWAGVAPPNLEDRRLLGSVYVTPGARVEDVWSDASRIYGVDRSSLTAQLVAAARSKHPRAIRFHWGAPLERVDFGARLAFFAAADPNQQQQPGGDGSGSGDGIGGGERYDLLVCADGARSASRAAMLAAGAPGLRVDPLSSPVAALEYKAFTGLPACPEIDALLPRTTLSNNGKDASSPPPRGSHFLAFTNPTPDNPSPGSVTMYAAATGGWAGVVYQPGGRYAQLGRDVEAHAAAVRALVPPSFPAAYVDSMARQMAEVDASGVTPMYLTSRLAWPEAAAVLLGDAAHNVTPQLGQGCNSALEDARLLAKALDAAAPEAIAEAADDIGGDPSAAAAQALADALAAYERARRPQAHALQRVEEENAWVRRPPAPGVEPARMTYMRVAWRALARLLKVAHSIATLPPAAALLSRFGRRAPPASLFEAVMATDAPYDRLRLMIVAAPVVVAALAAAALAAARAVVLAVLQAIAAARAGGVVAV